VGHPLACLRAIGLSAVPTGARSFAAIGDWAGANTEALTVLGAEVGRSTPTTTETLSP